MRKFLIVTAAALALAACGQADKQAKNSGLLEDSSVTDEAKPKSEIGDIKSKAELKAEFEKLAAESLAASTAFLEENATRDGVVVTASGLQYMVLEESPKDGLTPVSTDRVVVHYAGTLIDGVEFDSSIARGAAATFALNAVIPAWTEGVQLMSEGDKYRFFVPPDIGYGKTGSGSDIGPNEALIFDVELIKVKSAAVNLAESKSFLEGNANKDGVKTTATGLQYEVIAKGADGGASPTAQNTVTFHFIGSVVGGSEFASSYWRNQPAEVLLGSVDDKWTNEALQLMNNGDKFRFFIPPELGFGEVGIPRGPVGPNETMIFEIELIAVS